MNTGLPDSAANYRARSAPRVTVVNPVVTFVAGA
jgi:hypothetical protein